MADSIGDRYVAQLEEQLWKMMRGTGPHRPRGILVSHPVVENDWVRRRFLQGPLPIEKGEGA